MRKKHPPQQPFSPLPSSDLPAVHTQPVPPLSTTFAICALVSGAPLGLDELDELGHGHAALLIYLRARRREAKVVDAQDLVSVLVPGSGDTSLAGGRLRLHCLGQHLLNVLRRLALKSL